MPPISLTFPHQFYVMGERLSNVLYSCFLWTALAAPSHASAINHHTYFSRSVFLSDPFFFFPTGGLSVFLPPPRLNLGRVFVFLSTTVAMPLPGGAEVFLSRSKTTAPGLTSRQASCSVSLIGHSADLFELFPFILNGLVSARDSFLTGIGSRK